MERFRYNGRPTRVTRACRARRKECLITGTVQRKRHRDSFVFKGTLDRECHGHFYPFKYCDFPTVINGIDCQPGKLIRLVGTAFADGQWVGFLYEGTIKADGEWYSLGPAGATACSAQAISGNVIVGNYENGRTKSAFVYRVETDTFYEISYPGATRVSAYGVSQISPFEYLICGSIRIGGQQQAFIAKWNDSTQTLCKFRFYSLKDGGDTEFRDITIDRKGAILVAGEYAAAGRSTVALSALIKTFNSRPSWTIVGGAPASGRALLGRHFLLGLSGASRQLESVIWRLHKH